jgi:DNA-binding PadR family transcriptional regulator
MILKTLEAMGPLHGYGLARRIEQLSEAFPEPSSSARTPTAARCRSPT